MTVSGNPLRISEVYFHEDYERLTHDPVRWRGGRNQHALCESYLSAWETFRDIIQKDHPEKLSVHHDAVCAPKNSASVPELHLNSVANDGLHEEVCTGIGIVTSTAKVHMYLAISHEGADYAGITLVNERQIAALGTSKCILEPQTIACKLHLGLNIQDLESVIECDTVPYLTRMLNSAENTLEKCRRYLPSMPRLCLSGIIFVPSVGELSHFWCKYISWKGFVFIEQMYS